MHVLVQKREGGGRIRPPGQGARVHHGLGGLQQCRRAVGVQWFPQHRVIAGLHPVVVIDLHHLDFLGHASLVQLRLYAAQQIHAVLLRLQPIVHGARCFVIVGRLADVVLFVGIDLLLLQRALGHESEGLGVLVV